MAIRPRIFYISGALNYGAPGKIVEQIGKLAQNNGYEVMVAHSSRNLGRTSLPHIAVTNKSQEIVHAIGAKLFDKHGLMSTSQTRGVIKKIVDFKPDIIHLHNIHGYYLNFEVLFEYLAEANIPVVWTLHDCWPFTGRCFHFDGIGCEKWKSGCFDCKAESGYTVSPFFDRSKQLYELKKCLFNSVKDMTLVPVSQWLAQFLRDSFLRKYDVEVIQNGIDLNVFCPSDGGRIREKYNITDKFVILGVAAPWNRRKGLDDFIALRNILPEDFSIVLVGLTEKQIEMLPSGIIAVERTKSQAELAEYYSMADVFCNLTYLDTFPTVNLEALACGTPVLTYRTGGSPEAVDDSTGLVIQQGNIRAMAETMKRLKADFIFQSSECRARAEVFFDKDTQFNKYIDLYSNILKCK